MENPNLFNPHLEGDPFFWEGGPTGILLVHGFTATPAEVRLLAKILHERGFTVAGPLLPGHGTKPEDLNRVRWQDWVEEGEKAYRQLAQRCTKVFVGGESTGGLVALFLAARHPEIAGVLGYAAAIRLGLSRLDVVRMHLGSLFLTQVERGSLDCADKWQGYPGLPLKGGIQLLRMQKALLPRLPQIRQPAIFFQGKLDTTVAPIALDILDHGIASGVKEFHRLEKTCHTILLDQELDAVAELSLAFIKRVMDA